nr:hypothetical protein [Tanacetum cinerariifolium]
MDLKWQMAMLTIRAMRNKEATRRPVPTEVSTSNALVSQCSSSSSGSDNEATATIKKVNDVVQLRALIDSKKVVLPEDVIKRDLHLDNADGIECLPNKEIFAELARMGYEKPPHELTFYKAFFSPQWKFLIHTLLYMVRNVDSPSKFLMYLRFLQVVINNQVDDLISYNTRYTSPALTQKVFANMRRVGKGFSGVETPLFASMLVLSQLQTIEEEEEKEVEMPIAPTPPSPTNAPSPNAL